LNWWKTYLIKEVFMAEEADLICGLAVSPRSGEDRRIWRGTQSGQYTVRSAYHMAKERVEADFGSCSNVEQKKVTWKKLWACRVPNVVKNFLWKACNNILATNDNMFKKHITNDPLCPVCNLEVETIEHIIWLCPSASDVWSEMPRRINKTVSANVDFMGLMETLMEQVSEEELSLVATVARLIWFRRNSLVYEGKFSSPCTILRNAKDQMEAHSFAEQHGRYQQQSSDHHSPTRWKTPPVGIS
jgi:hypothetical protein